MIANLPEETQHHQPPYYTLDSCTCLRVFSKSRGIRNAGSRNGWKSSPRHINLDDLQLRVLHYPAGGRGRGEEGELTITSSGYSASRGVIRAPQAYVVSKVIILVKLYNSRRNRNLLFLFRTAPLIFKCVSCIPLARLLKSSLLPPTSSILHPAKPLRNLVPRARG